MEPTAHGSKNWPEVPEENMLWWTGKWQMMCQRVCIHVDLIKPVSQETNTNCPWNLQLTPYREIANIIENKETGPRWTQSTELLKIKHVWAMVWKLKQRVAWLGQRMIESKLIKTTSWTQQNRKMQVMSLESNNPKDGYSAGGRKHGSCFVLWGLRLQKIANKKILMCYISKTGSCNFGWWTEGHPITAKGGRKEFLHHFNATSSRIQFCSFHQFLLISNKWAANQKKRKIRDDW